MRTEGDGLHCERWHVGTGKVTHCHRVAEHELQRSHDGGGKMLSCGEHLAEMIDKVEATIPAYWSSAASRSVTVRRLPRR